MALRLVTVDCTMCKIVELWKFACCINHSRLNLNWQYWISHAGKFLIAETIGCWELLIFVYICVVNGSVCALEQRVFVVWVYTLVLADPCWPLGAWKESDGEMRGRRVVRMRKTDGVQLMETAVAAGRDLLAPGLVHISHYVSLSFSLLSEKFCWLLGIFGMLLENMRKRVWEWHTVNWIGQRGIKSVPVLHRNQWLCLLYNVL